MARDSVRTSCTGVAGTSSFWALGKLFKFLFFERRKTSSYLTPTLMNSLWQNPPGVSTVEALQAHSFSRRMLLPPPSKFFSEIFGMYQVVTPLPG